MARSTAQPASMELISLDQVEDVLINGATVDVIDADQLQADMVRRVLSAESVDEAFQSFEATPAEMIDGVLIDVEGIAWLKSSFDEGPAVFALLKVRGVESQEVMTVSMGGRTLMASFLWAQRNQEMPIRGTLRKQQSKTNANRAFWTFVLPPVAV